MKIIICDMILLLLFVEGNDILICEKDIFLSHFLHFGNEYMNQCERLTNSLNLFLDHSTT